MGFFDELQAWLELHGLPPWLGHAALALVLLAAIAYFFLGPYFQAREYRVFVAGAEGEAVSGAFVEIYDGSKSVASGQTVANGYASFRELPQKSLRVTVTKRGFNATSATIDFRARTLARIELIPSGGPTPTPAAGLVTLSVKVVDRSSKRAIPSALVVYAAEEATGTEKTDSGGIARVRARAGAQVSLRVTHPSYIFEALSVIAAPREFSVTLRSAAKAAALQAAGPSTRGLLILAVRADNGSAINEGEVRLLESSTGALLRSTVVESGSASLSGLPLGVRAFLEVRSPGYLDYSSADKPFEIKELTRAEAALTALGKAASTQFTTVSANGMPLLARVYVIPRESAIPLLDVRTLLSRNGTAEVSLATDKEFYAAVVEPGYVSPVLSQPFTGGAKVRLVLERANATNSANLTVKTLDELERPLSGARVTVTTLEGLFVSPAQTTGAKGSITFFDLRRGEDYRINAFYQNLNETERVSLSGSTEATITFELATGRALVRALNAITGKTLPAQFEAFPAYQRNATALCASAGEPCELRLRADTAHTIMASSPGFTPASTVLTLKGGERASLDLRLVPTGFANETRVEFLGLFDSAGNKLEVVRPGGTYPARFRLLSLPEVHESGLHVQVGERDDLLNETAGITAYSEALSVARSTSFRPQAQCLDLNNNTAVNGWYKWVELASPGGGSRDLSVDVQVSPFASSGSKLKLFFRGWARFDGTYSRFPEDARYRGLANTTSLAACYANTLVSTFDIIAGTDLDPALSKEFTVEGQVRFNEAARQLETNAPEFVLQVDPIFPADVLPLRFSSLEVLVEGINSTSNTTSCYQLDPTTLTLSFASHELNPACPLQVKGDKAPTDDTASLTFYFSKGPDVRKTIPIKVKAAATPSLSLFPRELRSAATPRLLYVVNNMQLGTRALKAKSPNADKELVFNAPAIRALAWSGAGEFSLSENGGTVDRASLQDAPTYFPGFYGQVSYLDSSCDSPGCCTTQWCDGLQASASLGLFLRSAKNYANQTFFRRGNGQPYNYFNKPGLLGQTKTASLHLLLHAREGATLAPPAGTDTPLKLDDASLAACEKGAPVVYDIAAETLDGLQWNLTANAAQLAGVNYFGANCTTSAGGRTLAAGSMPLCGFLYADASTPAACIKHVSHTITTSLEQASPEHAKPQEVKSAFDPSNATSQCQQASAAYAGAVSGLSGECNRIATTFKGCAARDKPLAACGEANCELQEATQACTKKCQDATTEGTNICTAAVLICSQLCKQAATAAQAVEAAASKAQAAASACGEPGAQAIAAYAQAHKATSRVTAEDAKSAAAIFANVGSNFEGCVASAQAAAAAAGLAANAPLEAACNKAIAACQAAVVAAQEASTAAAICAAEQAALTALATGAAIAPFSEDPTSVFMRGLGIVSFQAGGASAGGSCGTIGQQTNALVQGVLQGAAVQIAGILSKGSQTTASAIGCTISGAVCQLAVQQESQKCQEKCTSKSEACSQALQNAASTATTCETTQGYLYESPASLPTRAAWYTCYPYPDSCKLACQPKNALAQAVPWESQMRLIDRGGFTNDCVPLESAEFPKLAVKKPNELIDAFAAYRGQRPVDNGFFGVLDAALDPLAGQPDSGDLSRSEQIAKKLKEFNPPVTDETTNFTRNREHLQVFGGSAS